MKGKNAEGGRNEARLRWLVGRWWGVYGILLLVLVGFLTRAVGGNAGTGELAGASAEVVRAAGGFAGSGMCGECHAKEMADWKKSHHFFAERELGAGDREKFGKKLPNGAGVVRMDANGLAELVGKGFSREKSVETLPVVRVIGEAPLQQFLVRGPRGELQAHEAAWDMGKKEWFSVFGKEKRELGEWGHWTGRGMTWEAQCAACHNTNFEKHYDEASDRYHPTMAERSVSCESCHGGMAEHVAWEKSGKTGKKPVRKAISRDQMLDTCAACHARRGELTGNMQAGEKLLDHHQLAIPDETPAFFPDGQIHEEDYEANVFLGSKMHAAGVRCVDCHEPHSGKTRLQGNALCMQCHDGEKRDNLTKPAPVIDPQAHSFHGAESAGNQCISCHMPETTFMQRHARHDHGFPIPQPRLTKEFAIPNACNRCHTDRSVDWAMEQTERWYGAKMQRPQVARSTAIAQAREGNSAAIPVLLKTMERDEIPLWRASAARLLGRWVNDATVRRALSKATLDLSPLVRGYAVQALAPAVADAEIHAILAARLEDDTRWVRIEAAWILRAEVALDSKAGKELLQKLAHGADQPLGQLQLGQWEISRGNLEKSLPHFAKAVAWDAHAAPFRHDYAVALSMAGKLREAEQQMAAAVKCDAKQPDFWYQYGLILGENGKIEEAKNALEQAVQLAPDFASAWYNLAVLYANLNQKQAAWQAAKKAQALEPQNPRVQQLLESLTP